jgi:hypothetical protein
MRDIEDKLKAKEAELRKMDEAKKEKERRIQLEK